MLRKERYNRKTKQELQKNGPSFSLVLLLQLGVTNLRKMVSFCFAILGVLVIVSRCTCGITSYSLSFLLDFLHIEKYNFLRSFFYHPFIFCKAGKILISILIKSDELFWYPGIYVIPHVESGSSQGLDCS